MTPERTRPRAVQGGDDASGDRAARRRPDGELSRHRAVPRGSSPSRPYWARNNSSNEGSRLSSFGDAGGGQDLQQRLDRSAHVAADDTPVDLHRAHSRDRGQIRDRSVEGRFHGQGAEVSHLGRACPSRRACPPAGSRPGRRGPPPRSGCARRGRRSGPGRAPRGCSARNACSMIGSSPLVGSSRRRRSGRTISAPMRTTFWRLPFEYARTFLVGSRSNRATSSSRYASST